jgi:hypothetical protein
LYKSLTLLLFNLINLPNLMGARRSCGQLQIMTRKKGAVIWLAYTICNTHNILFLLSLIF